MKQTIKLFAVLFLLFGILTVKAEVANPPTSLLAAPTDDASKVLSFFSSTYTNATTVKNYSGTGTASVKTVLEKQMINIESGLNGWAYVNFNSALDISTYDSLNVDIYVVSGAFDLKITLAEGTASIVATPKLAEGWNRVRMSLNDFRNALTPPAMTSISKIGLINNGGYARTVYIDNIYAFGTAENTPVDSELPATMAPTPTRDAAKVKSIFSDAYTSISEITNLTGTGTLKVLSVTPTEKILKIEGGLNHWANLNFQPVNIEDREFLHVDIFAVRQSGTVTLKFRFDDGMGITISKILNAGWNYLDIPLSEFKEAGTSLVAITQFRIINNSGSAHNIFIDNLYAYGDDETGINPDDPTAPTTPAPTPKHDAADVKSIFSNAYTNITTLTQTNPGSPTSEMDFITPIEGNDMIRFTGMNWTLVSPNPAFNIDDMDYLHFDVYALTEPKIVLGLGNSSFQANTPWQYLTAGWNSINIPINVFKDGGADMTSVSLIRLFSASGFAISKLYFDNIYAFRGEPDGEVITYEILPAPEPIMAPKTVKSIYSNKYTNKTQLEEGAKGENTKLSFPKIEKDETVIKMFSLDNVSLRLTTITDISDMENVHFNVYKKGEGGTADMEIGFQAQDGAVFYTTLKPTLKDNDWTHVNISVQPLKDGGVDCTKIENVVFRGSGDLYVDNVFAYKGEYALGLGEEGKITVNWTEAGKADALPDRNLPLLGVNLASASGGTVHGILGQNYTYPSVDDLQYFKSEGVRLIRFPFRWARVQHEVNGPLDAELDLAKIKEVIAEAERLGMYVMPDMHDYCRRTVDGVTYKFGESDKLTKAHFGDVWKKLAGELKNFTNIWGYDIMNEPYGLATGVWMEYAQEAINSIRSVDTETPIVVEGESYAASSSWPSTGGKLINLVDPSQKLIFQAHCYFDADKSGLYKQGTYDAEVSSATQHIDRLRPYVNWLNENNAKGILGEFGVPRNDVRWLVMLEEVLEYLKENGVSGTYWVGGNGYANDHVSVQPLENFTVERAQMRILKKYFSDFGFSSTDDIRVANSKELFVYPNPVNDIVSINTEVEMKSVHVISFDGSSIKYLVASGKHVSVNLNDIANGLYLIQVQFNDGSMQTTKIVKQ